MADWSADNTGVLTENRQISSNIYHNINENGMNRQNSMTSSRSSQSSMSEKLFLDGGNMLSEESRTEHAKSNQKSYKEDNGKIPSIPPRNSTKSSSQLKPPSINLTPAESIPEETITIPSDGCLYGFTADQMSTFFRYLKVHDRIISYIHKKGINGKKFSTLKDCELDSLSINNPIVCHFRERSKRKKAAFML